VSDYEEVTVLNEGLRSRTSKTGRTTYSVVIKAEPIVVNTGPAALMAPIATAIAHHLKERMRGISQVASDATLRARKTAAKALSDGQDWAIQRYGGGRIGTKPPNRSNRMFNDSGRFADGLVAGYAGKDGTFRINVPANRLDERTTSGGAAGVQRIWERLVQLVPEFGDPSLLLQNDVIRATVKRSANDMIKKARETNGKLAIEAARGLFKIVQSVARIAGGT
jgi:hypothetical protein